MSNRPHSYILPPDNAPFSFHQGPVLETKPRIRIQPRPGILRCCACHDSILSPRERQRMLNCIRCKAAAHDDCQSLLDACPTLGCPGLLTPQHKAENSPGYHLKNYQNKRSPIGPLLKTIATLLGITLATMLIKGVWTISPFILYLLA